MSLRITSVILLLMFINPLIYAASTAQESVVLAGGCFWCIEADFEKLDGVVDVVSGYSGGQIENPTYNQVSSGASGHLEVVKVNFNPDKISYDQILDYFWRHIDPTRNDGQFCDRGSQYRPAIFYNNSKQKTAALRSMMMIDKSKPFPEPLKVELIQLTGFYPAEQYHQDYYKKNSYRYQFYRYSCGRDARIKELWGEDSH